MPENRGGPRQGRVGKQYPNRSDMQRGPRNTPAPGQPYGQAAEQQRAMQQVPIGPPPGYTPAPRSRPEPVPLDAPTQRPDEPVTAGMPFGPGPGPEVLPVTDAVLDNLLALYRQNPDNEDLRELIEDRTL